MSVAVPDLVLVRSMGPQEPDPFRFLTPVGRRLFVFSAVVTGLAFLFFHWLGIDPPSTPFGSGRQRLYSLGLAIALGIVSFAIGWSILKRRGISALDDDEDQT